jgi:16S rRNA (guanine966-N2)-methyltransferase
MSRPARSRPHAGVRIIAGRWRGRRIPVPNTGVRPSGDRIRETLFNWLQSDVRGARCLDMFAGTGVLGLEALSRGAADVLFVEQHAGNAKRLRETLAALGSERGQVVAADALSLDLGSYGRFDIVFLDPPFGSLDPGNLCTLLDESGALADDALIYLELHRKEELAGLPRGWTVRRQKVAGQVRFALLERAAAEQE